MDAIGIPEFWDLAEYWARTPPTHIALLELMAALGYQRQQPSVDSGADPEQQLNELLQAFGMAGGQVIHARGTA